MTESNLFIIDKFAWNNIAECKLFVLEKKT